jgi:hypothetical protein
MAWDLTEEETTYTRCNHRHRELVGSWRHQRQARGLRCLVCLRLDDAEPSKTEILHMHVICPYYADPRDPRSVAIFYDWLFT